MTTTQCPSISTMLRRQSNRMTHSQEITKRIHAHGWLELPNGKTYQPKPSEVLFLKEQALPHMPKPKKQRRWFARIMGIFA
ncbi:MAG: phage filamentation protein Fil family protein [Pseudomonadota bacterium]